jgi:type I restriction enzyme M protein
MPEITIAQILKDTNYGLSIFEEEEIKGLENRSKVRNSKPYIQCIIREKEILLKPEEVVRQLYVSRLMVRYHYPKKRIKLEHPVKFGRETKAADIVIFDKDRPLVEYVIVEVKKPKLKDGKDQLKSYCNATGAPIGVWSNGNQISYYNRKDPNYFEDITDIPNTDQTLFDIIQERFTWQDLVVRDKIANEGKSLKDIITEMEDEVLANAGVDVFEEVFKLIFTKLYDEDKSRGDKEYLDRLINQNLDEEKIGIYDEVKEYVAGIDDNTFRMLEFRNSGQTEGELKDKIQRLFNEAKRKWPGVFPEDAKIDLTPSHLSICVSSLQDIKLFNSNLQVIDEAFEYLVSKSSKGEKGQYFTPRHVIDMCVKMLNPKKGEYMIDPAAGSCGFTVHTIFYITGHLFENKAITQEEKEDVLKVFGIDFDEKVVRVARTLNLIAGDGETNVLHLNSLDYDRWD